jgi:hypothetical protein
MGSDLNRPLLNIGRGQTLRGQAGARVLARVLKLRIRIFPSVFECSRVLYLAINAHEIICLQPLSITVTAKGFGLNVPNLPQIAV